MCLSGPSEKHRRPKDTVATSKKKEKSTEWPGVHHPSHSYAPEDSFSLPSTYECNPAETKILRRWCVVPSYLMDGKRNDVCEPIYQWTLLDRPDPITEVSMGSTMAGYKYTYWGFSTHPHTMHRCMNKQTVHKLTRVWMGGFGRLCGHLQNWTVIWQHLHVVSLKQKKKFCSYPALQSMLNRFLLFFFNYIHFH